MPSVHVSSDAQDDLLEIVENLSSFSIATAVRLIEAYEKVLVDLSDFPLLGPASDVDPTTRVLHRNQYLFVYEATPEMALILRILDGRRPR